MAARWPKHNRPLSLISLAILVLLLAWSLGVGRLLANGAPTRKELERLDLSGKSGVPPTNPLMMAMLDSLEKAWFYSMYSDRQAIARTAKDMGRITGRYIEFLERLPRQKSMALRMKRRLRELSDYAARKDWKPENWLELNKRLVRWADTCTSCHLKFRDPDPEWFHGFPVLLKLVEEKGGEKTQAKAKGAQPDHQVKMAMLRSLELMWFYAVYSELLSVADAAQEMSGATDRYVAPLRGESGQKAMALEMKHRVEALYDYAEAQGWEAENSLELNKRLLAVADSCTSCHVKFRDPDPTWFQGFPVAVKLVVPKPEQPERAKEVTR